ncbi:MAG: hypothetical protein LQ349_000304, partial [Xanthoria aureola]
MAKQNGELTAAEKGKGKMSAWMEMVGNPTPEGKKHDEGNKGKDGKKGEEPDEEELSEEDQQLKSELEMLVSRLKEPDSTLYIPALDAIKDFIKTSTLSMTAVTKPLKFLMPHYADLTATYEGWPAGNEKAGRSSLSDSILSMYGQVAYDEHVAWERERAERAQREDEERRARRSEHVYCAVLANTVASFEKAGRELSSGTAILPSLVTDPHRQSSTTPPPTSQLSQERGQGSEDGLEKK